jgi:hypothetical protein
MALHPNVQNPADLAKFHEMLVMLGQGEKSTRPPIQDRWPTKPMSFARSSMADCPGVGLNG